MVLNTLSCLLQIRRLLIIDSLLRLFIPLILIVMLLLRGMLWLMRLLVMTLMRTIVCCICDSNSLLMTLMTRMLLIDYFLVMLLPQNI